ncbi:RING finger protein 10 [Borealophlyctis nickersoniae]|nr:RING finger protein 10 [Borealophlyctis nickersoniae]
MSRAYKMNANAPEFTPASAKQSGKDSPASTGGGRGGRRHFNNASSSPQPVIPKTGSGHRAQQKNESRPRKPQQRRQEASSARSVRQDGGFGIVEGVDVSAREWGSPNKRGAISMNHLLNFQLPPRQRHVPGPSPASRARKGVVYEPYNKERFVNANFRFIMNESGDYTVNLFDPDIIVDWKDIVQVVIPITKPPSCPICLSPPTAAQATKCGHVYCWSCILHYLHLGEKKWRKCPICYEAIYAKDLKSARFAMMEEVGKASLKRPVKVNMVLMQRALNSTVALPRSAYHTWSDINRSAPPSVTNVAAVPFAKLLLSAPEYLQVDILQRDRNELKAMLSEAAQEESAVRAVGKTGDGALRGGLASEKPFIEVALREVQESLEKVSIANSIRSSRTPPKSVSSATGPESQLSNSRAPNVSWFSDLNADVGRAQQGAVGNPFVDEDHSLNSSYTADVATLSNTSLGLDNGAGTLSATKQHEKQKGAQRAKTNMPPRDGMYYFYQSADGQPLFLHPLDIKALKHEFGEYEKFPDRIEVKALHVQESTMTEDLRKRCKYLGHMPLSCDVNFCEVDLQGLVSTHTLKVFEKEIESRIRRHQAEERKEEQEKRRSGATSQRQPIQHAYPAPDFDVDFPSHLAYEDHVVSGDEEQRSTGGSSLGESNTTEQLHAASNVGGSQSVPKPGGASDSFARIAAATTSSAAPWTRRPQRRYEDVDDDYMVDDYHGWTLDFEEAVIVDGGGARGVEGGRAGGKVRKGAKKVLLVTNGGNRRY